MKYSTPYPDGLISIKRVHILPPQLSYVSTLPDITQKPKRGIVELKH